MPASAAEFLSKLNDECAALRAFVVLLEDEQRILLGQHSDELLPLSEAKTKLTDKILTLSTARQKSLPQGMTDTQEWLKRNAPQGQKVWEEIRQLAANAQRINKINGELIQTKLRYNQQALGALSSAAQSAAGLYGADGQTSLPNVGRTHGSV